MKKLTNEFNPKSIKEVEKKIGETRHEIAKLQLEQKVNPPKDSNTLFKRRKQLAVLLTVLNEKQVAERLNP